MSFPLQIIVPFAGAEQGTMTTDKISTSVDAPFQRQDSVGLTIRTAPPFPLFFTSVRTRTLSGPYSLVYCNATWRSNGTSQILSHFN